MPLLAAPNTEVMIDGSYETTISHCPDDPETWGWTVRTRSGLVLAHGDDCGSKRQARDEANDAIKALSFVPF